MVTDNPKHGNRVTTPPKPAFVELATPEAAGQSRPGTRSPYDFGFVPNMRRLMLAHDEIGPAFGALFSQIMFKPGELSRAEREMVAAVAAATQDCFY